MILADDSPLRVHSAAGEAILAPSPSSGLSCLSLKYDTLLIFIFALPIFILALPSISLTVVCHVDQIICGVHHTIIFLPFSVFVAILIQILVLNGLEGEGIL
jgi:hypothetical protein